MQRPFAHGKGHLHLSASIGIARFPEHAQDAEQVFKCADIALAMAKQAGLRASVNLSPMQFRQGDLVATVEAALHESGLAAGLLSLELTEGVLMQDPEHAQKVLARLRESGVCFAVDDFGTGYSSLAYLKRFPLASLKILIRPDIALLVGRALARHVG